MITRTPMVDDDGSGTTGTVINNAWKQELYNQIDAAMGGAWISPPFSAADYTTDQGATQWVIDPADIASRYVIIGKTVFYSINVNTTTLTTAVQELRIKIPGGLIAGGPVGSRCYGLVRAFDSTGQTTGLAYTESGLGYINCRKYTGVLWAAGTNSVNIQGPLPFEIA